MRLETWDMKIPSNYNNAETKYMYKRTSQVARNHQKKCLMNYKLDNNHLTAKTLCTHISISIATYPDMDGVIWYGSQCNAMMENDWMCSEQQRSWNQTNSSSVQSKSERTRCRKERRWQNSVIYIPFSYLHFAWYPYQKQYWMVQSMWFDDGMFTVVCVRFWMMCWMLLA